MKYLLLLTLSFLFAGCLSPSPSPKIQYYRLHPANEFGRSEKEFNLPYLIIGPIDLSPYLDQPKFALKVNEHEIEYQSYQRWAEPLEVNIASVLAGNLRQYFQTSKIGPGAPKLLLSRELSRVLILLNRVDVDLEGNAHLSVQWSLNLNQNGEASKVYEGTYDTQAQGSDMLSRVSALHQLFNEFSLDLARTLEDEM